MSADGSAPSLTALDALLLTPRGVEVHAIRSTTVNASFPATISTDALHVARVLESAVAVCRAPLASTGGFAVQARGEGLLCVSAANGEPPLVLEAEVENTGIYLLAYSPCGNYLSALRRPRSTAAQSNGKGPADKNMRVYRCRDGALVFAQHQKNVNKDLWPIVHWSCDEKSMYRLVSNELQVYDTDQFNEIETQGPADGAVGIAARVSRRLRVDKVTYASASPASANLVALFVPEVKGNPGNVFIYDASRGIASGSDAAMPLPIAKKTFFKASEARIDWSPTGVAVLVLVTSAVDSSNSNYYGDSNLFFLSADGKIECKVPLTKEGPIHDARWCGRGGRGGFLVTHGFMPSKTVLFNDKCEAIWDLGTGSFNMIRWSPFGRFFVLGGFGNLAGDLAFYERKGDDSCRVLRTLRVPCTVDVEWAPDGRVLATSTTSPRLRVDNGFKLFKYTGELLLEREMDALFQLSFLPSSADGDEYVDRPSSPTGRKAVREAGETAAGDKAPAQGAGTVAKPKAYRPPGASSRGISSKIDFEKDGHTPESVGRIINLAKANHAKRLPVGADPVVESKSAAKNRKRRAKKAAAAAEAGA